MFCGYCGKELPEGSVKCDGCGKRVGGSGPSPAIFVVIAAVAIIVIVTAGLIISNISKKKEEEEKAEKIRIEQEAEKKQQEEEAKKAEEEAAKKAEEEAEKERLAAEAEKKKQEEEAAAAAAAEAAFDTDLEMQDSGILVDIAKNLKEEKLKDALDLMYSDEFKEIAKKIYKDETTDRYLYTTEYGDIGVFRADGKAESALGNTFIYYGRFKDGKRNGNAVWMEVDPDNSDQIYQLYCEDDYPEGEFTRNMYWKEQDGKDTVIKASGKVVHGFFEGDISFENPDGSVTTETYVNGLGGQNSRIVSISPELEEFGLADGTSSWGYAAETSDGDFIMLMPEDVDPYGGPEAYLQKIQNGEFKTGILGFHD